MTMVVVTHEMTFARDVSSRVVFMDGGRKIEEGPPDDDSCANPRHERLKSFLARIESLTPRSPRLRDALNRDEDLPEDMTAHSAPTFAPPWLEPIINVSGTMTALGASIVTSGRDPRAAEILPEWVEINDLHRKASARHRKFHWRRGWLCHGVRLRGHDARNRGRNDRRRFARIEQLPGHDGMKNEVVIQMGHMTGYGAPVEQAIRLAGANAVPVGNVTDARSYQLASKINERTAAALYVVSHHTVQYGQIRSMCLPQRVARRACPSSPISRRNAT